MFHLSHIIRAAAMPGQFEGDHNAEGLRFAVIASRFNDGIVSGLLDGATNCLLRHGAADDAVDIFRVPGAFEIPSVAARIVRKNRYDALVTIGALIRGDTPHFDHISAQVTTRDFAGGGGLGSADRLRCHYLQHARAG